VSSACDGVTAANPACRQSESGGSNKAFPSGLQLVCRSRCRLDGQSASQWEELSDH
jgi:hypothetical protein